MSQALAHDANDLYALLVELFGERHMSSSAAKSSRGAHTQIVVLASRSRKHHEALN
jgi:hypothetical protein